MVAPQTDGKCHINIRIQQIFKEEIIEKNDLLKIGGP